MYCTQHMSEPRNVILRLDFNITFVPFCVGTTQPIISFSLIFANNISSQEKTIKNNTMEFENCFVVLISRVLPRGNSV